MQTAIENWRLRDDGGKGRCGHGTCSTFQNPMDKYSSPRYNNFSSLPFSWIMIRELATLRSSITKEIFIFTRQAFIPFTQRHDGARTKTESFHGISHRKSSTNLWRLSGLILRRKCKLFAGRPDHVNQWPMESRSIGIEN